jgi:Transposase DDE domain
MYERLWTPLITLWYLVWQCLQPKHTLEKVVTDARRGGADRLCSRGKSLSQKLKSKATTSYSDARQRLPLDWVRECFGKVAATLLTLGQWCRPDLPIELLDGSTKRLRPQGDIPEHFPAHRTRRKHAYWCVARVLVSFCATTGLATAALLDSIHVSEQALAVQLILAAAKRVLYLGDRNFGVWPVVGAAVQGGGHAWVRLTKVRARRLLGRKRLPALLDQALLWSPSPHDQIDPGLCSEPVPGRLIVIQARRRGYRPLTLYLFTTLTDSQAYPPERLLEWYGWRWQVELDFRTIKSTMEMDQSAAKSADMVRKEFYAGLMAYNLVRGLMVAAAERSGCRPVELSFSKVQGLLAAILTELFLTWMSAPVSRRRLEWLLAEAAEARLPRRRKPRQNEPRAQYYEPQVFPKIKGSRKEARNNLKKRHSKS